MKKNEMILDKPYERFVLYGPSALSESELLAIILRTGTKDASALDIARQVLNLSDCNDKGILGLYDLSIEDLCRVKGVGGVKAIKLKAITELSMRIHRAGARERFAARDPKSVADYFMEEMRHLDNENVFLAGFDTKNQLLFETKLSEGSVNMSLISPRSVFTTALKRKAVYIILLHNHPSGDPTPSRTDIEFTDRIARAGEMLEVRLLDHIVIGDNRYYSFKEEGLLCR